MFFEVTITDKAGNRLLHDAAYSDGVVMLMQQYGYGLHMDDESLLRLVEAIALGDTATFTTVDGVSIAVLFTE